jgi:hypothetical protein
MKKILALAIIASFACGAAQAGVTEKTKKPKFGTATTEQTTVEINQPSSPIDIKSTAFCGDKLNPAVPGIVSDHCESLNSPGLPALM